MTNRKSNILNTQFSVLIFILIVGIIPARSQNYFQQEVNFKIQVTLDDQKQVLHAFEEIEYVNNSPYSLNFIYFHLWPNAYKNNETALAKQLYENEKFTFHKSDSLSKGWIDSLDFRYEGKKLHWVYDEHHKDICKVFLNTPLKSGERITLSTPFRVRIPSASFSRMGGFWNAFLSRNGIPNPLYMITMAGIQCPTWIRVNFIPNLGRMMCPLHFLKIMWLVLPAIW